MGELTVEAQSRIRAHGRRTTQQRRQILELLENRGGHPSAEELFVQARQRDPDIDRSTVYRTVRWLEAEGLIEPRRFEGTARKERFDPRSPRDHHHFVCESCGQVTEFSESIDHEVSRRFEAKHGGRGTRAKVIRFPPWAGTKEPFPSWVRLGLPSADPPSRLARNLAVETKDGSNANSPAGPIDQVQLTATWGERITQALGRWPPRPFPDGATSARDSAMNDHLGLHPPGREEIDSDASDIHKEGGT